MSVEPDDVLMRSAVRIEVTPGPDKRAHLPEESEPVVMGMHGALATFYDAPPQLEPHASTLDYVIAATGACLAGTFKRALIARGISIEPSALSATAVGEIVVRDGVPVIRAIDVAYRLVDTEPEDRDRIERAHAVHHRGCAVSRSLEGAISIRTELELV